MASSMAQTGVDMVPIMPTTLTCAFVLNSPVELSSSVVLAKGKQERMQSAKTNPRQGESLHVAEGRHWQRRSFISANGQPSQGERRWHQAKAKWEVWEAGQVKERNKWTRGPHGRIDLGAWTKTWRPNGAQIKSSGFRPRREGAQVELATFVQNPTSLLLQIRIASQLQVQIRIAIQLQVQI